MQEKIPKKSLLDLKIEISKRIFKKCCFCDRKCLINREKSIGYCKVKKSLISSEFLHIGEENILIPSHTIFFSGCTFHCVFCQNWDISQKISGSYIEPNILAEFIKKRKNQGSINVNWVGGDPTPNLLYILKTLKECKINIPQIWNSNMYYSYQTMSLLKGIIDLYLTDFKFGNDKCAKNLSNADNYLKTVKRNHKNALKNGEIIIRHLIMPNHIECCSKPILEWISKELPNVFVNIMAQYHPEYKAYNLKDMSRSINDEEFYIVKEYAEKLGINQL